ncbi:MAG: ParB/RepB/Spo0J family partition protein [Clostridia bacterium]|nr:ParB/RepB/Spo0J family partition protein [Clostridia bacterium]MBR5015652.1 ParB/RepB/Spo0J family partition protein [Clostridia bacterium]MBR6479038.1 ParB/RepB/Spo0J family partition protein [Clostridia bacterium]MBR6512191.1 ParB/RepB/Spo0J family partition protein [Clostridia bacterium]
MATAKKGGLGRGLEALFLDNAIEDIETIKGSTLKLNEIEPNKEQPRKTFDEKALQELANSIERNGILQPILVRPMADGSYQLVAGERRWRAARMAGLSEIPVVIKELSDEQAMEISLIENLQREDLNPIEEAEGLQLLIERYNLTQEEAAARVGRSRPAIANSLRLLNLPEEVRTLAKEGKISAGHARALLSFEKKADMLKTAKDIQKEDLSVRDVEKLARLSNKDENKEQKPRKKANRDTFYDEVELALSETLGRKVRVLVSKTGGTLEMEFFDKKDLQKLAKQLDTE